METVPEMIWAAPAEALPSPASVGQPCPPRAIRCLEAISDLGRAGHKRKTKSGSFSDQASAKGSKSPAMPGQGSCYATAPLCSGVGVPDLLGPLGQRGRGRQPEPRLLPAGAQRCPHMREAARSRPCFSWQVKEKREEENKATVYTSPPKQNRPLPSAISYCTKSFQDGRTNNK